MLILGNFVLVVNLLNHSKLLIKCIIKKLRKIKPKHKQINENITKYLLRLSIPCYWIRERIRKAALSPGIG